MPRYKCAHCGEIIDHLQYSCSAIESGNYHLETESWEDAEYEGSDSDDFYYSCPECGEGSEHRNSLFTEIGDDDEEDEESEDQPAPDVSESSRTEAVSGKLVETETEIRHCLQCRQPSHDTLCPICLNA